ncbi:MAG: hypothetical protein ABIR71_06625, partial [Chthoniobacterales bacterium]
MSPWAGRQFLRRHLHLGRKDATVEAHGRVLRDDPQLPLPQSRGSRAGLLRVHRLAFRLIRAFLDAVEQG